MTKRLTCCLLMLIGLVLAACGGGGGVPVGGGGGGAGGVGSGGTGIVAGFSVGPITGFGSIIVNGVTYDIETASIRLEDAPELQLGMVVEVRGTIDTVTGRGTAARVFSAADLRGAVGSIDSANARFALLGTTVHVDNATIWSGVADLSGVAVNDTLQVYGLLETPGSVRATRIERITGSVAPIVSGTITQLDAATSSFTLGGLQVQYTGASFGSEFPAAQLANGLQVRVRAAAAPVAGVLQASSIQPWYALPAATGNSGTGGTGGSTGGTGNGTGNGNGNGTGTGTGNAGSGGEGSTPTAVDLSGVIGNYSGPQSFTVLGTTVNAASAQVTGGTASSLGNGVTVEVSGTLQNGVLVAERLKIRHVPGTGGPVTYELTGPVANFGSTASFRVRGQPVDASAPGVVFSGGSAADLRNGVKVYVMGSEVVAGVLQAQRVSFVP